MILQVLPDLKCRELFIETLKSASAPLSYSSNPLKTKLFLDRSILRVFVFFQKVEVYIGHPRVLHKEVPSGVNTDWP